MLIIGQFETKNDAELVVAHLNRTAGICKRYPCSAVFYKADEQSKAMWTLTISDKAQVEMPQGKELGLLRLYHAALNYLLGFKDALKLWKQHALLLADDEDSTF